MCTYIYIYRPPCACCYLGSWPSTPCPRARRLSPSIPAPSKYNMPSCCEQRRQWHPTLVLLPGKSHGRRAWWAVVHGIAKSQTGLSDFTFTFPTQGSKLHLLHRQVDPLPLCHLKSLKWALKGAKCQKRNT